MIDFQYCCEYDYDREEDEDLHEKCDSYCRCSRIFNVRVESVNVASVVGQIAESLKITHEGKNRDIDKLYGIDRIVRHFKIYDVSKWEVSIEDGYYGQEVGSASFDHIDDVMNKIREYLQLKTTTARINFLLLMEYGHLLPALQNVEWKLVSCSKDDIHFGQEAYRKKIDLGTSEIYKDYQLPVAVVDGALGLVDGHHRVVASSKATQVRVYKAMEVK